MFVFIVYIAGIVLKKFKKSQTFPNVTKSDIHVKM